MLVVAHQATLNNGTPSRAQPRTPGWSSAASVAIVLGADRHPFDGPQRRRSTVQSLYGRAMRGPQSTPRKGWHMEGRESDMERREGGESGDTGGQSGGSEWGGSSGSDMGGSDM